VLDLLWLVPALPFAGFVLLTLLGKSLSRKAMTTIGVGSMLVSAVVSMLITVSFLNSPPEGGVFVQYIWTWFDVGGLKPTIALALDPLALVMMTVITFVGFLIHVYSAEFMREDEAYGRFFSYMNLFVGFMLMLVLADNLLQLYLGWEGVGLCSYLLIGFWHKEAANGRAAQKAFIVTRVGDTAMAIGLFLLVNEFHTLDIAEIQTLATEQWAEGSGIAIAAAALLFGGAIGKSAQLPLQTWLPDAMAGPSPVSALIHAATMVTAGVYLIARMHDLFALAPPVLMAVAIVGVVTQLTMGISALHQRDIKRILAYSTISQLGYMFLALGVSADGAAVYHLMTHACFKATWFLAAGAIIVIYHHEHDIFKMGGLGRRMPYLFWIMFFAGVGPFFSKDLILTEVWFSPQGGRILWVFGVLGVFVTSLYLFRLLFTVFHGEERIRPGKGPGPAILVPLIILATLSVLAAFVEFPILFNYHPIQPGISLVAVHDGTMVAIERFAVGTSLFGIYMAYYWFRRHKHMEKDYKNEDEVVVPHVTTGPRHFFLDGWGFDKLYNKVFVAPFIAIANHNRDDFVDSGYTFLARTVRSFHGALRLTQSGRIRWYAAGIAVGTVVALGMAVFA
jgi:NADH-quinone oxidoreductase subunit L